jgi:sugar phosphate isomerase/epimerase
VIHTCNNTGRESHAGTAKTPEKTKTSERERPITMIKNKIPRLPKTDKPRVAVFLAQPCGTLIGSGQDKFFVNIWELLRWLRQECGFEGFTLQTDPSILDPFKALQSESYLSDFMGTCANLGMPLLGLEGHVIFNPLGGIHSSRVPRFKGYFPEVFKRSERSGMDDQQAVEAASEAACRAWIDVSHWAGFSEMVAFISGRDWAAGQYQWPGWPPEFRLNAHALVASKIIPTLEYAADRGVRIAAEGHPEMTVTSPRSLLLLRALIHSVNPNAAVMLGANADLSHEQLLGGDGAAMIDMLAKLGLIFRCHLKDGAVTSNAEGFDPLPDALVQFIRQALVLPTGAEPLSDSALERLVAIGGCSRYGDLEQWSRGARRFQTFGTGQGNWGVALPALLRVHKESKFGLPFVGEAECSLIKYMPQALKIMADNIRAGIDGRPFVDMRKIALESSPTDWEAFAKSNSHTAQQLLQFTGPEGLAVREIIGKLPPEVRAAF